MSENSAERRRKPVRLDAQTLFRLWELEKRAADLQDEARALRDQAYAWEASRWGSVRRAAEEAGPRTTFRQRVRAGRRIARALVKPDRDAPAIPPARAGRAEKERSTRRPRHIAQEETEPTPETSGVAARATTLAEKVRSGRRLTVAAIMDPFTRLAFDPECDIVDLHPQTWEEELLAADADLLFVESAWRGDADAWHDTVQTCPQELVDIVAWCREHGIVSVFWNKEDPVYFDRFVKVAALVDHVFTTDLEIIPRYVHDLGHHRVHVLPFAAQPSICNPIEVGRRKDAAVFAGSYYAGFKDRNKALFAEIEGTTRVLPVEIFDRNYGTEEPTLQWPDPYRQMVVGTLPADQIDIAYKGYKVALNVNTVTTSQTMLARRAFDLLASGTPTVSNFSPSIKVLFGDLIAASDSADEIERAVRQIVDDRDRTDKLRAMGVRHVMGQHTYSARFKHLIEVVSGAEVPETATVVGVVAHAADLDDLARWRGLVAAEPRRTLRLLVVSDDAAVRDACARDGVAHLGVDDAASCPVLEALPDVVAVASLHPDHWYGPHYLTGLLDALDYSPALASAKTTRYRLAADGGEELVDDDHEYRWWSGAAVSWHRAIVRADALGSAVVGDVVQGCDLRVESGRILGVDRFDFGEGLGGGEHEHLSAQLPIQTGSSVAALVEAEPVGTAWTIPYEIYPTDLAGSRPKRGFLARRADEGVLVGWSYANGYHYVPFQQAIALDEFDAGVVHLKMEVEAAGTIGVNASWLDGDGERIPGVTFRVNEEVRVEIPAEARSLLLFLRVKGKGTALIRSVSVGARSWSPPIILGGWSSRTLVLTNAYPSYRNLYQNGFVHSRVRGYRERGLDVDVFTLAHGRDRREFHGVQVMAGDEGVLEQLLASGRYDRVLVHFLNQRMWGVLQRHLGRIPITVWVHGYEIQPWWRRMSNYTTEAELAAAKEVSAQRMELWRQVSIADPDDLKLVFVSEAFRTEIEADLGEAGIEFEERATRIVPNPIDTSVFSYVPKDVAMRLNVLMIRPFTRTYPNDLAVEAIHDLSREPWFDELSFRIIGDGPLFDEVTAPLIVFPNVTVEKRFLSHAEIAALHQEYGVFLVPTSQDTQGVSRDEAMASGLVPITNDIPAIREFLSDAEGYIAPRGDAKGLADAIRHLHDHPEVFAAKSRASAQRIRRTVESDVVIPREIAIFDRAPSRPTDGMEVVQ